jgi:hypothetical protein
VVSNSFFQTLGLYVLEGVKVYLCISKYIHRTYKAGSNNKTPAFPVSLFEVRIFIHLEAIWLSPSDHLFLFVSPLNLHYPKIKLSCLPFPIVLL